MNEKEIKTILLVEDEILIAETESRILEKNGFTVIAVRTGEEALEAVERAPAPDLVLMDINLGSGMDGTEAAERILIRHDLPLVFLSSRTEHAVVDKMDRVTSYGYIFKDSGEAVMIASIKMAFRLFDARKKEGAQDAARREGEARLIALSDNLPGGLVYQIDSGSNGQERRFSHLSAGVFPMHGVTAAEAMNDPLLIYGQVVEDDRALIAEREATAYSRMEPMICELRMRMPSGEIRWRSFASAPRRQGGRVVWDGIEFDITERKRIEESLRDRETRLVTVTENSPDLIVQVDRNAKITFLNRSFPGASMDKILGASVYRWAPAEHHPQIGSIFKAVFVRGEQCEFEMPGLNLTGQQHYYKIRVMPVLLNGKTVSAVCNLTDITEFRKVASELQESEANLAAVFRLSQSAISIARLSDNVCIDVNPAFCALFEVDRSDVIGKDMRSLDLWAEPEQRASFMKTLQENRRLLDVEMRYRSRSGGTGSVLLSAGILNLSGQDCAILSGRPLP